MFVLSPSTVLNPGVLETKSVPRRVLGRVAVWPRGGGGPGLWLRLIFEMELLRYLSALLPFVVAALVWRDSALAISQAPLPMFLVVWLVETRVLRVPRARRTALADPAEVDRVADLLRHRAVAILGRIAAGRGLTEGRLLLVVEQSELRHVPPLALVSVQDAGARAVLRLSPAEVSVIRSGLFDADLTEGRLQTASLAAGGEMLRAVAFEARAVSAHTRLAARLGG